MFPQSVLNAVNDMMQMRLPLVLVQNTPDSALPEYVIPQEQLGQFLSASIMSMRSEEDSIVANLGAQCMVYDYGYLQETRNLLIKFFAEQHNSSIDPPIESAADFCTDTFAEAYARNIGDQIFERLMPAVQNEINERFAFNLANNDDFAGINDPALFSNITLEEYKAAVWAATTNPILSDNYPLMQFERNGTTIEGEARNYTFGTPVGFAEMFAVAMDRAIKDRDVTLEGLPQTTLTIDDLFDNPEIDANFPTSEYIAAALRLGTELGIEIRNKTAFLEPTTIDPEIHGVVPTHGITFSRPPTIYPIMI